MKFLVTGGAGFIGSALVRWLIDNSHSVINLDKLTYAGHLESLETVENHKNYHFEKGDICDGELVRSLFKHCKPDGVIHLAAESHVDRSIDGSAEFIRTNIIGTHNLLKQANRYYRSLDEDKKIIFDSYMCQRMKCAGPLVMMVILQKTLSMTPILHILPAKALRITWQEHGTIHTDCRC
jgi:dTDP-glucose 4,6-dehydratase